MSKLLSYLRFSAALFCLVVLAACQTMDGTGLIQSEVTAELSTEAAGSIAADMVGRLAEHIGPGNCPSSDNLGHLSGFRFGGSGSSLIEFMRFQFGGASAG